VGGNRGEMREREREKAKRVTDINRQTTAGDNAALLSSYHDTEPHTLF